MKMAIYLDPVGANNGALRVVPGSHKMGDTFAEEAVHALMGHPRKDPKLMPDDADGMAEFIAAYMRKRGNGRSCGSRSPTGIGGVRL
jgi:phytanoyl-CoA dioxygenase PhyH